VIEKVLKMVKPPTNRAMRAKTTSAVEKTDRAWLMDGRLLVDHRLAGHHLDAGGRIRAMARCTVAWFAPGRGQDVDGVDLPDQTEELLGGGQVEGRDGRPGQVVGRAELQEPVMVKVWGAWEQDADALAHDEVVLLRGPASITRRSTSSGLPLDQLESGELRVGVEGEAGRGCTSVADGVAVGRHELGVAGDRPSA
jgi:hypothetical protein